MNDEGRKTVPTWVAEDRVIGLWTDPVDALPAWTETVHADGYKIRLYPPADFELPFKLKTYMIFSPYARATLEASIEDEPSRRASYAPGSIFFAPPGVTIRAKLLNPIEFLVISADPEQVEPFFDRVAGGQSWTPQVLENFVEPGFGALHLELRRALLNDSLREPAYLASVANAMFARIGCKLAGTAIRSEAKEALSPGMLRRLVEYVETNIAKRVSVEELAELAGFSRSHFSRAFQSGTGEAPQEFIIGRRISRARDLLVETDNSIAEIAARTGFTSHAHLSAAFKKRLGVSPAAYRKSFNSNDS
ncbi:MAG: AraC family transcriptional regulator [Pseudomonadota bacterium]